MAFGNASAERAAIELTYEDTATVSRTTSQRGKNNISTSWLNSDKELIYLSTVS